MNRYEVKEAAKQVVIDALMNVQEFGYEQIEGTNITEDANGRLVPKWTPEEVQTIAQEAAVQAERAILLMERKRKR